MLGVPGGVGSKVVREGYRFGGVQTSGVCGIFVSVLLHGDYRPAGAAGQTGGTSRMGQRLRTEGEIGIIKHCFQEAA